MIASASIPHRNGFSLLELLLALGIVAILMVVTSLGVSTLSQRAKSVQCMTNLKALGMGIQQYTIDYQGRLPVRMKPVNTTVKQQWHREMWPSFRHPSETRDWGVVRTEASGNQYRQWPFHCPADVDPASLTPGLSYAMNVRLTDGRVTQLGATQILLLEMKNTYMANGSLAELPNVPGRHQGRNHVLFSDYHIEVLKAEEIPRLATHPEVWNLR